MTVHPDFEDLSAFVDGQAPEWSSHVSECGSCRAALDRLRAVQAAVAVPVERVAAGERDRAVATAVAAAVAGRPAPLAATDRTPSPAAPAGPSLTPPRPVATAPDRSWRWLVPASAAAALLLVVGAVSVLSQGGRSENQTATAGRILESPESAPTVGGRGGADAAADSAGAATTSSGDLGEIPDAATLLARARPGLAAKGAPVVGPATTAPSALRGRSEAVPAPATVGTRPCEEQARSRDPALREVVYFATATRQGQTAVVLGLSTGPPPAPVTLLLLSQDGCAVLLRTAGP